MVRISDIFKKTSSSARQNPADIKPKEESFKEKPSAELKSEIPYPMDTSPRRAMAQKDKIETGEFQQEHVARGMNATAEDRARSRNLYLMGVQLVREVFLNIEQLKSINLIQIKQWVSDVIGCFMSGDTELLRLFYEYASENYMHDHMLNTVIMSIELGLGLGYNKSQLNELSLAAFLHDIGMIKVDKLAMEERKLSEKEYAQIKEHPLYGVEILSKTKDVPEPVIYAVKEAHERQDGSGYPRGLRNGEMSEYSRVIAIVDVYEALTHNRPHRKKFPLHQAIKELIADSALFDPSILKTLIKKVGVYPVSSLVELNSNEIGMITMNNDGFPLRPVIQVLFDTKRHRLKNPHCINLAEQFNLFIKRAISEEELAGEIKGPLEI